jgi:hypothetical protein
MLRRSKRQTPADLAIDWRRRDHSLLFQKDLP